MTQATQEPLSDDEKALRRAHKRAGDIRGFYLHLIIYLVANAGLFLIDVLDGDGWWFDWIAVPWGIFLAGHAIVVFVGRRFFGAEWEQRKVDKYLHQDDTRRR